MQLTRDIAAQLDEAYRVMADHGYRAAAPSDGLGNIEDFDALNIDAEVASYTARWWKEEDDCGTYWIGFPNFTERRALVYLIEAARCISSGAADWSLTLTRLAVAEFEQLARDGDTPRGSVLGPPCHDALAKVKGQAA
jgi:hypothetical protein